MKYKIIQTIGSQQIIEEFEFDSIEDFIEYKQYMMWEEEQLTARLDENFKDMVESYLKEEDVSEEPPEETKH